MKKHLLAISLSLVTVFTCVFLWLTPKLTFDTVTVINESGDASVLDHLTVSGSFVFESNESKGEVYQSGVRFGWLDGKTSFTNVLVGDFLSISNTNARHKIIEDYPIWHRPNLDYTRLLQTVGDQQVWAGIMPLGSNGEFENYLKVVIIDAENKDFETVEYKLQTGPLYHSNIVSFAQLTENELKFLVMDVTDIKGEKLIELQLNLLDLSISEAKVSFHNPEGLTLIDADIENHYVAPKDYLLYLTDDQSESGRYGGGAVKAFVRMDAQTHENQIIPVEDMAVKVDGVNYDVVNVFVHGEEWFMYANSGITDFGVDASSVPVGMIFKYLDGEFESIYQIKSENGNYSLREGLFYFSHTLDKKSTRLIVFNPALEKVVYQADFFLETDKAVEMKPINVY